MFIKFVISHFNITIGITGDTTKIQSISEFGRVNEENILPEKNGMKQKRLRRQPEFLFTTSSDSTRRSMKKRKTGHKGTSVSPVSSKDVVKKNVSSAAKSSKSSKSPSAVSLKVVENTYEEKEREIMMRKWKETLQLPLDSEVNLQQANRGYYEALKKIIKSGGNIHDANR